MSRYQQSMQNSQCLILHRSSWALLPYKIAEVFWEGSRGAGQLTLAGGAAGWREDSVHSRAHERGEGSRMLQRETL